jgi:Domain of unknown function (DUF4180)
VRPLSHNPPSEVLLKDDLLPDHGAIVGDISRNLNGSASDRDFVSESNRGRHVWFAADLAGLDARLEPALRRPPG